MKKILSILMIALTVFFMMLPATAIDGEDTDVEYWSELVDTELYNHTEEEDPFGLICYDPLINYFNNNEDYVEEPCEDVQEEFVSPYVLNKVEPEKDMNIYFTELAEDELNCESGGADFDNIISVEGQVEKNRTYLYSLIKPRYSGHTFQGQLYLNMQGSCSDGEYVYYAFFIGDKYQPEGSKKYVYKPLEICIVSGKFNESNEFVTTSIRFTGDMVQDNCLTQMDALKHANDITYNSLLDKLVVACAENGYNNEIYMLDAAFFRGETDVLPSVKKYEVSCMINSIAYNEERNGYVSMLKGTDMYFVLFDRDFNLIGAFNCNTNEKGEEGENIEDASILLSHQGICCDDNYIYATYYLVDPEGAFRNVVAIFDWDGNRIKEINLQKKEEDGVEQIDSCVYEIEGISILNDRIILNFNVLWRKTFDKDNNQGKENDPFRVMHFYQYDMSDLCFNIKYCPDDNVATHINNGNLRNNTVIHGISTNLLDNTYMNYGYKFAGWHLYSPETNKWRYKNGNTTGWYVEGSQPANYEKIVYPEKTSVKQTVPAGMNLMLCAVWTETDKFYVSYNGNGATAGSMDAQAMIYGEKNYLNANTFTKTVNGVAVDFLGWNPYSPEVNKWYYESADKSHRAWYVEGEEPTGYTKVLYTNGGYVRQTTKPGGHIVLFALWNEFTIYYDAGGKLIKSEKEHILLPTVVHKGIQVQLKQYSLSSIDGKETDVPDAFNGYHQYHVESERWRYVRDDNTTVWLTNSDTLQLYTYPYGTIRNGLTAGQRVVFSADWS